MANIIATETQAKSIGGSSASVTANLMVTRVRAVALGCSIRNSYSDKQLVCLKDLYKLGCTGECDANCACKSSNCTCNSTCDCTGGHCNCNTTCTCTTTGCSCTDVCSCEAKCDGECSNCYPNACVGDGTGSTYKCTCHTTCTCTTTGCSCTSGNCNCEVACDGECSNCACNGTNCTCNSHCKCNTNWVINCNGQEPNYRVPGVSSSGNTSTCTGECTSVCNNCFRLCSTNECSSACCDSGYYQGCGCNGCHGTYDGYGFGCYEVWKCNRECDPYGISCSCTNNNIYKCTCHTTCACTTTGCSCTDQCVCEAKCDGECSNCACQTTNCTCNTTCDCTGGHCSCNTTCACTTTGCSCTSGNCSCEQKCDGECANCNPNACVGDGTGSTYKCTCNTTCECTSVCVNDCQSNNG